ncbi:MAG: peptidylprolyl isomerase [Rickettsiales bacterium]|jgi:parvulin-like peptidyl-prolyl isomerase|nr:peptidylprolyl isomerase [Rickettsiales bacterium]
MRKHEIKILKICILLAVFMVTGLVSLGAYLHYRRYHFIDKGAVIATVNRHKVYKEEIESKLRTFNSEIEFEDLDNDTKTAILLESYVNAKILKLAKKEKKMNELKFLREEYYKQLIVNHYIENVVFRDITENDIKERYDELVESIKDKEEREIHHILLPTEEEARRVLALILRSGNFGNVAQRRSKDKASAIRGGNIGYVIKEELENQDFADIVFLLKEGEISKPIETKDGWHIVKVNDIRMIKPKSYEKSRDETLKNLKQEKYNEFIEKFRLEEIEKNIIFKKERNTVEEPMQQFLEKKELISNEQ